MEKQAQLTDHLEQSSPPDHAPQEFTVLNFWSYAPVTTPIPTMDIKQSQEQIL